MAEIFVHRTHYEAGGKAVTGISFTLEYAKSTATITVLEFDPLSLDRPDDDLRARILELADALRDRAQSQPGIPLPHQERPK